jgi:hypothetical protein
MSTGVIYPSRVSALCPGCRRTTRTQDWTCPACGAILDRYLFSTIRAESLSERERTAFDAGYDACMNQWKASRSTELAPYKPDRGHETSYRAGWHCAATKIEARAERKRGRRRGVVLLAIGAGLTAVGAPLAFLSFNQQIRVV